jgi:hypothetical protein
LVTTDNPQDQAEHNRRTREAYEALRLFSGELAGLVGVPVFIVYRLWLRP